MLCILIGQMFIQWPNGFIGTMQDYDSLLTRGRLLPHFQCICQMCLLWVRGHNLFLIHPVNRIGFHYPCLKSYKSYILFFLSSYGAISGLYMKNTPLSSNNMGGQNSLLQVRSLTWQYTTIKTSFIYNTVIILLSFDLSNIVDQMVSWLHLAFIPASTLYFIQPLWSLYISL